MKPCLKASHAAFFEPLVAPFVGELFADFDAFEPLVNPVVVVAQLYVLRQCAVYRELGVLHFVQPLAGDLCQP